MVDIALGLERECDDKLATLEPNAKTEKTLLLQKHMCGSARYIG